MKLLAAVTLIVGLATPMETAQAQAPGETASVPPQRSAWTALGWSVGSLALGGVAVGIGSRSPNESIQMGIISNSSPGLALAVRF